MGIRARDRLVIVSETSANALVLLLASQRIGAWPAMVNARLSAVEMKRMAACVEPRAIAFALEGSDEAANHAKSWSAAAFDIAGLGHLAITSIDEASCPEAPIAGSSAEVALLVFTSGTSGLPRAVMLSHAGLLNMGRVVGEARGTKETDTIDVAAPLSHAMGLSSVVPALIYGATARLRPRLSLAELARAIGRGDVQQVSMVPAAWVRLLERVEREHIDLSKHALRTLVTGGAPLDPALKARIERTFGRPLVNAYGMTECAPLSRTRASADVAPWSVGRPEANVEVRIVDAAQCAVPHGEIGEIQARGPGVMLGYYRDPGATRDALRAGGWYATGDLGQWLPDGDLAVVGRRKEMIIRSGFNVYPAEVEAAIALHPAVSQVAVVGRPAAFGDEQIVAYVELRPGQQPDDALLETLESQVREQLVSYKFPSRYIFVDAMPLGATGKILKRDLPDIAEAPQSASPPF